MGRCVLADHPARRADVDLRLRVDAVLRLSRSRAARPGLYSIVGLATAGIVTRFVLSYLLPQDFAIRDVSRLGRALAHLAARASRLRVPLAVLLLASVAVLVLQRHGLWSQELSALSPVPKANQDLDERLRADVGAPDVRYLIVVSAASEQRARSGGKRRRAPATAGRPAGDRRFRESRALSAEQCRPARASRACRSPYPTHAPRRCATSRFV